MVTAAFLDFESLGPGDLDTAELTRLLPGIALHPNTAPAEVGRRIAGVELVMVNKVRLDRSHIQAAPALRYIGVAATGTDNVDLEAARERGIAVTNIRDYGTPAVVQHVFGLVLALTLRLPEYRELLSAGGWERSEHFCRLDFPIRELAGKTFGVVGPGQLGRAVAAVARAFGMTVVAAGRPGSGRALPPDIRGVGLDELLAESHVVSLHCPLTPATRGLIGREALARMRPDALLINTARGALVDPVALAEALTAGRIAGAGIDVLEAEPPPAGHPLLALRLPNLIITPHIAWAARESRQRALDQVVANARAFLAGESRNRVEGGPGAPP
jgi:glycerate dehydrogenase